MVLNIKELDFDALYEKEDYSLQGALCIKKYYNSSNEDEPIIYVYDFDELGNVNAMYCGNYINREYQNEGEFSIKGWVIDKDSPMNDVGKEETRKEFSFFFPSIRKLTEIEQFFVETTLLIYLADPTAYYNNENGKGSK